MNASRSARAPGVPTVLLRVIRSNDASAWANSSSSWAYSRLTCLCSAAISTARTSCAWFGSAGDDVDSVTASVMVFSLPARSLRTHIRA